MNSNVALSPGNHCDFSCTNFLTALSAWLWGQKGEQGVRRCLQNRWYLCFTAELACWKDPWPSTAPLRVARSKRACLLTFVQFFRWKQNKIIWLLWRKGNSFMLETNFNFPRWYCSHPQPSNLPLPLSCWAWHRHTTDQKNKGTA